MSYRLGVDVGGTFTDFLLCNEETGQFWRHKMAEIKGRMNAKGMAAVSFPRSISRASIFAASA